MAFEPIENCKPLPAGTVPPRGVRVQARRMAGRKGAAKEGGGALTRYVKISVGAELARRLVWKSETIRCALAFGSGRDAGKIRVAIDMTAGQFMARRDARGNYALTLNAKTCEGLFALEFPEFAVPEIAPVEAMGTPPALVFAASPEMLAVE